MRSLLVTISHTSVTQAPCWNFGRGTWVLAWNLVSEQSLTNDTRSLPVLGNCQDRSEGTLHPYESLTTENPGRLYPSFGADLTALEAWTTTFEHLGWFARFSPTKVLLCKSCAPFAFSSSPLLASAWRYTPNVDISLLVPSRASK